MEANTDTVAVTEVTTTANTEKYWGKVIDNRVYLYKGKTQISFEDCGSHEVAKDIADKFYKEHGTVSFEVLGPAISAEKQRHINYMAKVHATEKAAKKEAKKVAKNKEQVLVEIDELQKRLAMLGE